MGRSHRRPPHSESYRAAPVRRMLTNSYGVVGAVTVTVTRDALPSF